MIFVTGGTGLLGNCIVRELCARGIATRVLCRQATPRTPFDGLDVEVIEGDLSDRQALRSAIDGCEAVIHSAAFIHIGWQKLALSRQVNVEGTQAIIDACLASQARLIHISTVDTLPAAISKDEPIDERGVGGVPKTPCAYVISKTEAEQAVRQAILQRGLEAVILHPGFMLGPYDWKPSSGRMFLEVCRTPVVAAPRGGCSLCDARDVAAAVVVSVQQGVSGENYILAGENLTYVELWSRMLETAGRRRRVFRLGPGIRLVGQAIDAWNRALPNREGDVNGAAIAMGGLNHFYDSSKAMRQFGYQSRITNKILSEAWDWLSAK